MQLDEFRSDVGTVAPRFVVAHDFSIGENVRQPIASLDGTADLRRYLEELDAPSIKERVYAGTVERFGLFATDFVEQAERSGADLRAIVDRFEGYAEAASSDYDPAPGKEVGGLFHEFVQSKRGPVRRSIGNSSAAVVRGASTLGRAPTMSVREASTPHSGGPGGPRDQALLAGHAALARTRLERLAGIFGDRFYVELQRHGLEEEKLVEPELLSLAYALDIPLVATNQPFFPTPDDFEAHDALICIAEGSYSAVDDRRRLSPQHYFKSAAEMAALFDDLPEALDNTVEIARRCAYRPRTREPILPHSASLAAEAGGLKTQAEKGLRKRLS